MKSLRNFLAAALCITAVASVYSASEAEIERGWLQALNPGGRPVTSIRDEHIYEAVELLNTTIELVERDGGTLTPAQINATEKMNSRVRNNRIRKPRDLFMQIRWLRREILFRHPQLSFDKILINRTPPTYYSHNGDQHLGRHSRSGPGLTVLSDWKTKPVEKSLLNKKLPAGAVRNPDLHFDGDRVLFAFCDHTWADDPVMVSNGRPKQHGSSAKRGKLERRYFIYEAAIDGSWVRQITGTKSDAFSTADNRASVIVEDNDPCYLPDGDIAFISTRSQTFGRCHGGRYNPAWVLYRCGPDVEKMRQLSFGNENEYEPSVINDGRLVFSRWEYTNRHEMLFHMLWQCRLDGTGVANYYGNDTLHPMMVTEQTPIPGSHKVVAIAMGHHQFNTGTVIVIDPNKGENGEKPLVHVTPETPYAETKGWPKPHYSHPYPITENLFLVSRANHVLPSQGRIPPENDRAIYLIDDFGGREFIYEDRDVASFSPIPIQPRTRPPVVPSMVSDNPEQEGTLFLQNVYLTRNDSKEQLKPGMIHSLRINALGVQPRAERQVCTPYVSVEIPKKVLGTVPVNPDGSACFNIPAKTPVQLQALDKDGRAVLTEKSFFYLQPGERRSCIGCHEPTGSSPDMITMAGLMRKGPTPLKPAAGPDYPGGMAFAKTVQPVLDRYCIECHGLEETSGGVNLLYQSVSKVDKDEWSQGNLTARQYGALIRSLSTYPQSYIELTRRGNFELGSKAHMNREHGNISEAFEAFYARGCTVSDMILANHGGVEMDEDSRLRIFEWMDLNAPMNGDIFPDSNRMEDRRFDNKAMKDLREEVVRQLSRKWADQPDCALVNRVFPQESRVLMALLAEEAGGWGQVDLWESKNDPGYKRMEKLVMQSFIRPENENDMGWLPTSEKGAAEPWVATDREAYLRMINEK